MYAKTLYKPTVPEYAEKIIKSYVKKKVPHFFLYAKGKTEKQVEDSNNSTVNRIKKIFPKRNLNFNFTYSNIGRFDYRVLLNNPASVGSYEVYAHYRSIVGKLDFNKSTDRLADGDKSLYNYAAVYDDCRHRFYQWGYARGIEPSDLLDSLIVQIFTKNKTAKKKAFWAMFGDDIYKNIQKNISNSFIRCQRCKKRYLRVNSDCVCEKCRKLLDRRKKKMIICADCGKVVEINKDDRSPKRCVDCARKQIANSKIVWRIINTG